VLRFAFVQSYPTYAKENTVLFYNPERAKGRFVLVNCERELAFLALLASYSSAAKAGRFYRTLPQV
jgi:hypothetical protein